MITSRRSFIAGSSAAIIAGVAPRAAWAKTQADVIVIGAGLAGLTAAQRLEVFGKKVILLEGSSRIGGRLHTLNDLPGRPEAGGVQVGSNYRLLHHLADDLKIALIPGGNEPRTALYRINGETISEAAWKDSPANRTVGRERAVPPARLMSLYARDMPSFEKPSDWMSPTAAQYDVILGDYLISKGLSDEAHRLIRANFNGNGLGMSMVHMMRSAAIFKAGAGPVYTIEGGSQRLPEAFARAMNCEIRLNAPVAAIREGKSGVDIRLASGERLSARHCVCTIPFSAMQGVALDAPESAATRLIGNNLPYTRASFAYLLAREPFWKEDGFAPTLWTDDPLLGRVFVLGEDPPMLKVWLSGPFADALDAMDTDSAGAAIIARYEAARPAAKGKLQLMRIFSWQKERFARGIYHHLGIGHREDAAAAAQHFGGRLHFAGEHLAQAYSGMEAAMQSGDRIARKLLGQNEG
jgi:monoamine oxidase